MKNLIHAELLKLQTTRAFWAYIAFALAFVPVSIALTMTVSNDGLLLDSSEGITAVFSAASAGGLLLLLLGITMMAGEFRHNTATPTFLITPDRRRVIAAKLAAGSVVGVLATAVSSLLTLAIALPWLAARDIDVSLLSTDVGAPILGGLIVVLASLASGWVAALSAFILFLGVHALESYVLTPIIQRQALDIPPATLFAFQILLSVVFGIWGLALALPLMAIAKVMIDHFKAEDVPATTMAA